MTYRFFLVESGTPKSKADEYLSQRKAALVEWTDFAKSCGAVTVFGSSRPYGVCTKHNKEPEGFKKAGRTDDYFRWVPRKNDVGRLISRRMNDLPEIPENTIGFLDGPSIGNNIIDFRPEPYTPQAMLLYERGLSCVALPISDGITAEKSEPAKYRLDHECPAGCREISEVDWIKMTREIA